MAIACGKVAVVTVAATDTTGTAVGYVTNAPFDVGFDVLDITCYLDTATKIASGMKTANFSIDFLFDDSDTGQDIIRAACAAGSSVWVSVLPDATNGARCQCLCTKISHSPDVKGMSKCTATFAANGAWAEV